MKKAQMIQKMIDFYEGSVHDVEHFLKVLSYAGMIGKLEGLDEKTQDILEMAAIVHDIACPLCREKYGNTDGKHQEIESEGLLRPFLFEFNLAEEVLERVIYLVSHHQKSQRRKQERGFWIRSILGEGGLAGAALDIEQYDVVFVGYPIWWYIAPTIINTFLESYDFSGKTIVPFAT